MRSYQDIITTFGLPPLSERFEFIRQLGNVFLVQPGILRSYITENYLGRIDAALLRPYLAQRADWAQIEKSFDGVGLELGADELSAVGVTVSGTGIGDVKTFKERLGVGRLSSLMKDMNLNLNGPMTMMDGRLSMHLPSGVHLPPLPNGISGGLSSISQAARTFGAGM